MTLTTTTSRNTYVGAGTVGPFPYTFRIIAATDVRVTRWSAAGVRTELASPADFTVTGVGAAGGGTVTLTTALAVGESLSIRRVRPLTQETSFRNQGPFFPASYEDALDHLAMIAQQHQDDVGRSLKVPGTTDITVVDPTLPNPEPGGTLRWNATGTALESVLVGGDVVGISQATADGRYVRQVGNGVITGTLKTTQRFTVDSGGIVATKSTFPTISVTGSLLRLDDQDSFVGSTIYVDMSRGDTIQGRIEQPYGTDVLCIGSRGGIELKPNSVGVGGTVGAVRVKGGNLLIENANNRIIGFETIVAGQTLILQYGGIGNEIRSTFGASSKMTSFHGVIMTSNAGDVARFGEQNLKAITIYNSANPGVNPVGGGYLYAEAGALKWRGSAGTITTIANA